MDELEKLLGDYWGLAYKEGRLQLSNGDAANEVLHKIREAWNRRAEQSASDEPFEMDWPEFHAEAMGCGLEDRNITDRYEAMRYGWDEAIERCAERLPEKIFIRPRAQPCAKCADFERRMDYWRDTAKDHINKLAALEAENKRLLDAGATYQKKWMDADATIAQLREKADYWERNANEANAANRKTIAQQAERIKNQVALLEKQQADSLFLVQQNQKQDERIKQLERAVKQNDETAQHYLAGRTEALQQPAAAMKDAERLDLLVAAMCSIETGSPVFVELDKLDRICEDEMRQPTRDEIIKAIDNAIAVHKELQ